MAHQSILRMTVLGCSPETGHAPWRHSLRLLDRSAQRRCSARLHTRTMIPPCSFGPLPVPLFHRVAGDRFLGRIEPAPCAKTGEQGVAGATRYQRLRQVFRYQTSWGFVEVFSPAGASTSTFGAGNIAYSLSAIFRYAMIAPLICGCS